MDALEVTLQPGASQVGPKVALCRFCVEGKLRCAVHNGLNAFSRLILPLTYICDFLVVVCVVFELSVDREMFQVGIIILIFQLDGRLL